MSERTDEKARRFTERYGTDKPIGEARSVCRGLDMTPIKMSLPSRSPGDSEQAISKIRCDVKNKLQEGGGDE